MIFSHSTISTYLKSVLAARSTRDTAYSLRTMARELEISPAHLSQIMSKKKTLSPRTRLKVAHQLGLDERETRYFYMLVQCETAPSDEIRTSIEKELNDIRLQYTELALDADQFKIIADWYHLPILEMTYLDGFECDAAGIAHRLGITELQAEAAIARLERLGMLKRTDDGVYCKTDPNYVFRTSLRNEAFGHFLKQMMALAADALSKQPIAERVMMSQTFCIDRGQIDEARQLTREYMQRMAGLFETANQREHTYQLNVQFFNLTDGNAKAT